MTLKEQITNNLIYLVEYSQSLHPTFCGLFNTLETSQTYIIESMIEFAQDEYEKPNINQTYQLFNDNWNYTIKPILINKEKPVYVHYNGNYFFTHITQNKDEWEQLMKKSYGNYEAKCDLKRYVYHF
jgi:hypothetical protein